MQQQMARLPRGTPLLLHVCCAPCASAVIERLQDHFELVLYYYNPNIRPQAEHDRRYETLCALLRQMPAGTLGVRLLDARYDPAPFDAAAQGLEAEPEGGARCTGCFDIRLRQSARKAAELGIGWFTTTLTVSPHKNAALLNSLGGEVAKQQGVQFLPCDFKKQDGYKRSIALSAQYGLYRQDYCGCAYSRREP